MSLFKSNSQPETVDTNIKKLTRNLDDHYEVKNIASKILKNFNKKSVKITTEENNMSNTKHEYLGVMTFDRCEVIESNPSGIDDSNFICPVILLNEKFQKIEIDGFKIVSIEDASEIQNNTNVGGKRRKSRKQKSKFRKTRKFRKSKK